MVFMVFLTFFVSADVPLMMCNTAVRAHLNVIIILQKIPNLLMYYTSLPKLKKNTESHNKAKETHPGVRGFETKQKKIDYRYRDFLEC